MASEVEKVSRFLSLVLRHEPDKIGLSLDVNGWAAVEELITQSALHSTRFDRQLLQRVVDENDKKRFAFSDDGLRIRASQGHSIPVDLGLTPAEPPAYLFHGTVVRFVESIKRSGLHAGERQHVHLSSDTTTATRVGQRRGTPVILTVLTHDMWTSGHAFYLSANGVWLTEKVPVEFIRFG